MQTIGRTASAHALSRQGSAARVGASVAKLRWQQRKARRYANAGDDAKLLSLLAPTLTTILVFGRADDDARLAAMVKRTNTNEATAR